MPGLRTIAATLLPRRGVLYFDPVALGHDPSAGSRLQIGSRCSHRSAPISIPKRLDGGRPLVTRAPLLLMGAGESVGSMSESLAAMVPDSRRHSSERQS